MSAQQTALNGRFRASFGVLYREIAKFGVVGAVAFVVDFGVFNLLRSGIIGGDHGLAEKPLTAKAVSVILSTIVAWVGSRWWTFRHRRSDNPRRELVLFFAVNAVALVIALACLAVSHYVLGLRSALDDNISTNGVGLVLGTLFRFAAYRALVFNSPEEAAYLNDEPLDDQAEPDDDGPQAEILDLRPRTTRPAGPAADPGRQRREA